MPKFADLSVTAFLDALASPTPTPGGGTAAAIAGAMGTSLLVMVAALSRSRTGAQAELVALAEAAAKLTSVRERFAVLADADSDAYGRVVDAYKLPKASDADKSARNLAVQQALTVATTVPLDTLRTAAEAMRLAIIVAQHGNRNAVSDAAVGVGLVQAAADGAVANVRTNIGSLRDEAFAASAASEAERISTALDQDAAKAKAALEG